MPYEMFARWFGIISIILSLGVLFNLGDAKQMTRHMLNNESGYLMAGVLPIIFGSLSFMQVNSFNTSWQLAVSLIGLFMLIAGVFRVLFVSTWKKLVAHYLEAIPTMFSLFGLIFGLLLLYVGFFAPVVHYPG